MENLDELTPTVALDSALLLLLGAALGALFAVVVAPRWTPDLAASLMGSSPKAYWYLARGSGFVAYWLLWLSVALGVAVTNKLSRVWPGGPAAVDLHQFTSLLALAFAVFHALILLGDRYIGYTLLRLLVPFASTDYRPLWVGLGQVGFYLAVPVAFSFYVRRRIGYHAWRLLHYGSFVVYFLATIHGLGAGTDATTPAVVALYALTGIAIYFLTVHRILMSVRRPRPAAQQRTGALHFNLINTEGEGLHAEPQFGYAIPAHQGKDNSIHRGRTPTAHRNGSWSGNGRTPHGDRQQLQPNRPDDTRAP